MRKIFAVLLVVCLTFSLCACDFLKDISDMAANPVAQTKTFDLDGVSIVLNTNFARMDFVDKEYDFILGDSDISIFGIKTSIEQDVIDIITAYDYAVSYQEILEIEDKTEVTEIDGIPTMNAEMDDKKAAFMFYKAKDCIWVIMFSTDVEKFDGLYDEICNYAKTVNVNV